MPRVGLWNPMVLIPAGVLVIIIGLVIWLQAASRRKRYTGETTAEVLSVTSGSRYARGRTQDVYTPRLAYTIDGNRYEVDGQSSNLFDYYVAGSQINVRYDPDKPNKCLSIPTEDSQRGAAATMLIGAGLCVLGVIALLTR